MSRLLNLVKYVMLMKECSNWLALHARSLAHNTQDVIIMSFNRALSEKDAFLYCGHGSRMKNLTWQDIEKLNVKAVPLLFGCNSGRLERMGR